MFSLTSDPPKKNIDNVCVLPPNIVNDDGKVADAVCVVLTPERPLYKMMSLGDVL